MCKTGCQFGKFRMARFTISSLRSPLPAWCPRPAPSEYCSINKRFQTLPNYSTSHAAPFVHKLPSQSSSRSMEVLENSQVRLMPFKVASLNNFCGKRMSKASAPGLRSHNSLSFNSRDVGRASVRLPYIRASSFSSISSSNGGMLLNCSSSYAGINAP